MNSDLQVYIEKINKELDHFDFGSHPKELYDPIRYMLSLGGKRMRPLLAVLAYKLFDDNIDVVLKPAAAIEVFHNFTLMHDDIMDNAPVRRGHSTIHEKWNSSTAILSGDVALVRVYDMMLAVAPDHFRLVIQKLNKCAAEVCEGQQLDMNFESYSHVSEASYLEMIRRKTAVLLGYSLELGGILAGADADICQKLNKIGEQAGLGFQLKDDLLDVYADKNKFGKRVGGDIISNKKTFLLIKALESADEKSGAELDRWLASTDFDPEEKVRAVTDIYDHLQIRSVTEKKMNGYFDSALKLLEELEARQAEKDALKQFLQQLINREK